MTVTIITDSVMAHLRADEIGGSATPTEFYLIAPPGRPFRVYTTVALSSAWPHFSQ
jgi:hypothetical protein